MIVKLLLSGFLVALCVTVHAVGMMGTLRRIKNSSALTISRFWPPIRLLIRIAALIILMHLFEISLWAFVFAWGGAMPDLQTALYFSSVTYTTVGYGDLVLPKEWRLLGGVEALTGILMCGWSTGFFFAIANHMYKSTVAKTPAD